MGSNGCLEPGYTMVGIQFNGKQNAQPWDLGLMFSCWKPGSSAIRWEHRRGFCVANPKELAFIDSKKVSNPELVFEHVRTPGIDVPDMSKPRLSWTLPRNKQPKNVSVEQKAASGPTLHNSTAEWQSYSQRSDLVGGCFPRGQKTTHGNSGFHLRVGWTNAWLLEWSIPKDWMLQQKWPLLWFCCYPPCSSRAHSIARNPILVGFKIVDGNWKKYPSIFFTPKDGFRHV